MTTPDPCGNCGYQPRMVFHVPGNRVLEADGTITREDDVTAWTSCECNIDEETEDDDLPTV